jgi:hypothetical protein
MIERIRHSWHLFARRRPGVRFRERYRLHQSRRRRGGRFDFVRLLYIVGGVMLIVLSALFGWLPVLGWGTAFLGLGMIAAEFYPIARLMDWLEVRARRIFKPLGKTFVRLPTWAQLSISLTIAVSTFVLVYGVYSLTLGG